MSARPIWSSVTIAVGTCPNHLTHIRLNHYIRERCLKRGALAPGVVLPNVEVHPFCIVLTYLSGDESLSVFESQATDPSFLLIFAQTWALAARLRLPTLQNELISVMSSLYTMIVEGICSYQRSAWVDTHLLRAFQHLRSQFGPETHAEKFLVCFSGRTAPLVRELEKQLSSKDFDLDIREKILKEARSFERDPIIHRPYLFRVSALNPPRYPPLDVQRLSQDEGENTDARRFDGAPDNPRPRCAKPILSTPYTRSRRYEQLHHERRSQTQSGIYDSGASPSTADFASTTTVSRRRVSFRLQHQDTMCDSDPTSE
ncbi:hypothetical protein COCMIDRAFT_95572 [Bipolaris oryzae ATCC 44560]|uniref:Uncharacterized protein n=1 Tax=Bipolaris oryzae ATCC 44560 TaxID=930090 RepID=W6ZDA3_COCMI|nr:uncharacterized protein COCMIDRAFT_95572 [Bipolaris oryzae ATCC 44560]EUC45424.1 hypothetical protein COCMIDRAFT_95572 [Bipolaris oryzae ATCC 44560]